MTKNTSVESTDAPYLITLVTADLVTTDDQLDPQVSLFK